MEPEVAQGASKRRETTLRWLWVLIDSTTVEDLL